MPVGNQVMQGRDGQWDQFAEALYWLSDSLFDLFMYLSDTPSPPAADDWDEDTFADAYDEVSILERELSHLARTTKSMAHLANVVTNSLSSTRTKRDILSWWSGEDGSEQISATLDDLSDFADSSSVFAPDLGKEYDDAIASWHACEKLAMNLAPLGGDDPYYA